MQDESILKRLKIINDLKEEIGKVKALYDESLEDDNSLQEAEEQAEKIKNELKERKLKVFAKPEVQEMNFKLKELKDELKENNEILAQELADYYKESGSLQITDEEGNQKRIKFSAKLISS